MAVTDIGDTGATSLSEALKCCFQLRELGLTGELFECVRGCDVCEVLVLWPDAQVSSAHD